MIVKFTCPSERVKGLSFHPKRPWLLTGLHTGSIHLWDYRLQHVIEKFDGHEGPVRTVQFHPKLSLFASGGDDFSVRVWNYKTKKCAFILKGHLDFVRSVSFHPDMPWVISSSDDQTARVWNYQSRQMIAILTGHSHYVMQAQFHPTAELIVTCSLDQTLRLWNFSALVKKYSSKKTQDFTISGAEIELIQIMEGHNAGVNWCSFHHDQSLIVSAADDKKIKIWKYSATRCWEQDQLSGHTNNVSSAIFHPKFDVMISNSEDKTMRVWDYNKILEVDSFTNKELDRFWVVAGHPDNFYFAGGSDSALYVFTLFKDRVPCVMNGQHYLFYALRKTVRLMDFRTNIDQAIKTLDSMSSISDNVLLDNIESIQYNSYDTQKHYLMIRLKQSRQADKYAKYILFYYDATKTKSLQSQESKTFQARSAVFVGKSKIVRVKESKEIELYSYENDQSSLCFPNSTEYLTEGVHQYIGGKVLFTSDNNLYVLDPLAKKITNKIEFNGQIKQVIWSGTTQSFFAILCKRQVTIFTKTLSKVTMILEKINIKSGCWINQNIFLYSTKAQIKYLLLNGDNGILKSTENIIYLTQCKLTDKNKWELIGMDSQCNVFQQEIDLQEVLFKQALYEKDIKTIQIQLKTQQNLGDSLISYLYKKNFASLAINLVQDTRARFSLAIDSNNLEISFKAAQQLKDKLCFKQLAEEALRQGNQNIVEISYQSLKEFDKLTFFYMINGDQAKLRKMQQIANQRANIHSRFQSATFLGDVKERVRILQDSGQSSLAYLSALSHGLQEEAQEIKSQLNINDQLLLNLEQSKLFLKQNKPQALQPLNSLIKTSQSNLVNNFNMNWPHNFIAEEDLLILAGNNEQQALEQQIAEQNDKTDVLLVNYTEQINPNNKRQESKPDEDTGDGGQWGIEDVEVSAPEQPQTKVESTQQKPTPSQSQQIALDQKHLKLGISQGEFQKFQSSIIAHDQIQISNYQQSLQNLKKQINLKNKTNLKDTFQSIIYTQSQLIAQIPFISFHEQHVTSSHLSSEVKDLIKQGYKQTTEGKFADTLTTFQKVLRIIPLLKVHTQVEEQEIKSDVLLSKNYIMAMQLELEKKKQPDNPGRVIELACFMAVCNLQPAHKILTLRAAMTLSYKQKNFITTTHLAKRLINLIEKAPQNATYAKPEIVQNAKKVLTASEQVGQNALKIDFDEKLLYDDLAVDKICAEKFILIQKLKGKCPYDYSCYQELPNVCNICQLSGFGEETLGLKILQ